MLTVTSEQILGQLVSHWQSWVFVIKFFFFFVDHLLHLWNYSSTSLLERISSFKYILQSQDKKLGGIQYTEKVGVLIFLWHFLNLKWNL